MTFQKPLVAYDGSEQAIQALKTGLRLAVSFGTSLRVVHVFEIPMLATGDAMMTPSASSLAAFAAESEQKVEEARSIAAADAPSVHVDAEVLQGHAADTIVKAAEQGGHDLIIIGSRGRSSIKELLLGSVSQSVVQRSKVPVLLIKSADA